MKCSNKLSTLNITQGIWIIAWNWFIYLKSRLSPALKFSNKFCRNFVDAVRGTIFCNENVGIEIRFGHKAMIPIGQLLKRSKLIQLYSYLGQIFSTKMQIFKWVYCARCCRNKSTNFAKPSQVPWVALRRTQFVFWKIGFHQSNGNAKNTWLSPFTSAMQKCCCTWTDFGVRN